MKTEMPATPPEPLILVVDDDRRVRELLEIAFGAHGFRVITAADGEEAIRRSIGERPDLIVLDIRLPKRSGLEVCETLRHETDGKLVPIIVVSAATEGETRLQAFHRGADDYLVKPFSPRELLARVKRLLARSGELKVARERLDALEREVVRARDESRRAQRDHEAIERQRAYGRRLESDLGRAADAHGVVSRLLRAAQRELDAPVAVLMVRDGDEIVPWAARGELLARLAPLRIAVDGELGHFLARRGKPILRTSADRLPELAPELRAFGDARLELLSPLGRDGALFAMLATSAPRHGTLDAGQVEILREISDAAARAIAAAVEERARAMGLADLVLSALGGAASVAIRRDAADRVVRAARAFVSPPVRDVVRLAVAAGRGALEPGGMSALERIQSIDPTGLAAELRATLLDADRPDGGAPAPAERVEPSERDPWEEDVARAARPLVLAGWRITAMLERGVPVHEATAAVAADAVGLGAELRRALESAGDVLPEPTPGP